MNPEIQKKLVIISAPSGCGKSTIIGKLLEKRKDIRFSVSTTTRKPRPGEVHGVNYYFVSEEAFLAMKKNGEFLEWARVHNNYYGTSKAEVERIALEGSFCLLDIDVQGAIQILHLFSECRNIFILPPSVEELKKRLIKRGDTDEEQMAVRLANAIEELKYVPYYKYFLVNDDLESTVLKVEKIIDGV